MASTPSPLGLLFSHDWGQLQTPRALIDTNIKEVPNASYQTSTFVLTNELQFKTFVHGLGKCEFDSTGNCHLQLLQRSKCKSTNDCDNKSFCAIVKQVHKVTHQSFQAGDEKVLSTDAIKYLQELENQTQNDMKTNVVGFLKKFGSHFQTNVELGKSFSWIVAVEEKCNMELLAEIAEEVFAICSVNESRNPGSHKGIWYSLRHVVDDSAWSEEKQRILQSARLCVVQHGMDSKEMSFKEWEQTLIANKLVNVHVRNAHFETVWDLIKDSHETFKNPHKLASMVEEGWTELAAGTEHSTGALYAEMRDMDLIRVHLGYLLDDLAMKNYFPAKLDLQTVRCIHFKGKDAMAIKGLPWQVLDEMMFLNAKCREEHIEKLSCEAKQMRKQNKLTMNPSKKVTIPHPMDVTLLIFLCSDYMLRQVLAKKLFILRLAIPFIFPIAEDKVEILMWPLRSIVMEWRDNQSTKEEELVKCKLNMVAFMRLGDIEISKSDMMNTILSQNSHATFYNKEIDCGSENRKISNGTVEVSHFLPSASGKDHFSQPALFFNLRGDACDFPVQRRMMMDLATVLVIYADPEMLQQVLVHEVFCDMCAGETKYRVIVVLTGDEDEREQYLKGLNEQIPIVRTCRKGKNMRNKEIIQHITDSMDQHPQYSLEDFAKRNTSDDEGSQCCTAGKKIAKQILLEVGAPTDDLRPLPLLPTLELLGETGVLLRKLHRNAAKLAPLNDKEEIKQQLEKIATRQASASAGNSLTKTFISMLLHEPHDTKRFAIKWAQMELDALSRPVLPNLHTTKQKICRKSKKEKHHATGPNGSMKSVKEKANEEDAATFGLEHIMRYVANLYNIMVDHKLDIEYDLSSLPDIVAQLLLEGQPMELMDGDHGLIPLSWVKAVFGSLAGLVGNKTIFVLSVMGIQSSGKSTLLNAMFGLELAVSAGRCTKGIYAQLLRCDTASGLPFDYMLVLDSEGLRAQELDRHGHGHDNELATLIIGLSDITIVNVMGENLSDITDVLQIVVQAFVRMKLADSTHKKQCMFIHQNVSAVSAEKKLAKDRQKFQKKLNSETRKASPSLHQNKTSFNDVISFDCQQDVLYFPGLWEGNPPMATVNEEYFLKAVTAKQTILTKISQHKEKLLTLSEFTTRIEDIWKGVLADDFIFNFRNSLAAKAYLDLGREFARLTMEIEVNVLHWVNTFCDPQVQSCNTESDINQTVTSLIESLEDLIVKERNETKKKLDKFLDQRRDREIIMQWKAEKHMSLQMFGNLTTGRMQIKLENMKLWRKIQLQQEEMIQAKEQDIMGQAITLAEKLRGVCPNEALERRFDEIWKPWAEEFFEEANAEKKQAQTVVSELYTVLQNIMDREGYQAFLKEEQGKSSGSSGELSTEFTPQDLEHNYIDVKHGKKQRRRDSATCYFTKASEQANVMMTAVMNEVERIARQNVMFDPHHGRQVIDFALKEVRKYNDQKSVPFSFSPQFQAMFALRVVHCAAPIFESMNQHFNKKNYMKQKLKDTRPLVFAQFKHAVHDAAVEVRISDYVCACMKPALVRHVRLQIDQRVLEVLNTELGTAKYILITRMLDEIAMKRDFTALYSYVMDPVEHAQSWIKTRGERFIFGDEHGESRYKRFVHEFVRRTISKVQNSSKTATRRVLELESDQHREWVTIFCTEMGTDTIPLNELQLEYSGSTVKYFEHFQNCLENQLPDLEGILIEDLCRATAESVTWANDESPFLRIHQHVWGCRAVCPFCREPCQYSDPNHSTNMPHSCIQHRPAGLKSSHYQSSKLLVVETCSANVASKEKTFACSVCNYQCRNTPHCTATGEDVQHPCREYQKFIPEWDIQPDPSGESSKFWQWAMCTFQKDLVERFHVEGVKIPKSWKKVTEREARDSLRRFSAK